MLSLSHDYHNFLFIGNQEFPLTSLQTNATSISDKTPIVSQSATCSPLAPSTSAPSPQSTLSTSSSAFVSSTPSVSSLAAKFNSTSKTGKILPSAGQG